MDGSVLTAASCRKGTFTKPGASRRNLDSLPSLESGAAAPPSPSSSPSPSSPSLRDPSPSLHPPPYLQINGKRLSVSPLLLLLSGLPPPLKTSLPELQQKPRLGPPGERPTWVTV